MQKIFVLFALILMAPQLQASPLSDYLVFSRTTIVGRRSDFQGSTAALGNVTLQNFLINGRLETLGRAQVSSGAVTAGVSANSLVTQNSTVRRIGPSTASQSKMQLTDASFQLDGLALAMNSLPPTSTAIREPGSGNRTYLRLHVSRDLDVVEISADDFAQAENIEIDGSGKILVRILGLNPEFTRKGVFISGSMTAEKIVFFFPEANRLEIRNSGGARDGSGKPLGIPGAVVAPFASVTFAEALVTGPLYVGRLCDSGESRTGQVNYGRSLIIDELLPKGCDCNRGIITLE